MSQDARNWFLNQLEGQEITSLTHGGAVTVRNGQLVMEGEVIDPAPDVVTLKELFDEYLAQSVPF